MNTFFWHLKLSALNDRDRFDRPVLCALGHILDLLHDVVAFEHLAEDNVTPIEPAVHWLARSLRPIMCVIPRDGGGDEELRTVGVLACVCHAQQALLGVLQLEVFIFKLVPVDGFAASPITLGEITTLNHEVLDDAVERRPFVAEAFGARSEDSEILGGLELCQLRLLGRVRGTDSWDRLAIEAKHDLAEGLVTVLNVEVDLVGDLRALRCLSGLAHEEEGGGQNDHKGHDDPLKVRHVEKH